jgi:acyl-CoA synthetase (AMP-forming)/AMP-acid ligase II
MGRPLLENRVKIIAPRVGPIASLDQARELPDGEVGEIIVTGPTVTKAYDALPEETAAAKISAGASVWHRLGDAGYRDAVGRLWFCGRLVERVETAGGILYTEPCEQVFRRHPAVARCALIGLGPRRAQTPALVVQPKGDLADAAALARELRSLAQAQPHTAGITRYFFHPSFPVDVRHNAKIHRLTLARWAAKQHGHTVN